VAEPDPRVADLLIEVLGTMGFAADIAPDRDAVLARLAGGEYQALIADHTLPNLDGRLLLEALRARQPALARRVIFLAGDPGDARLMAFVSSSGNMLVGKPFDPVALRAAVRRLVVTTLIDDAPVH
jgi:DNA-binding response OmpR family regulator